MTDQRIVGHMEHFVSMLTKKQLLLTDLMLLKNKLSSFETTLFNAYSAKKFLHQKKKDGTITDNEESQLKFSDVNIICIEKEITRIKNEIDILMTKINE